MPSTVWRWLGVLKRNSGDVPLGVRAEAEAARFLRRRGYRILLRNFRCDLGEVDLIARQGRTLVFVEVKSRREDIVRPEDRVDREKQRHVMRVARHYLIRYGVNAPEHRFDIVAIVWPEGKSPEITHFENAFG